MEGQQPILPPRQAMDFLGQAVRKSPMNADDHEMAFDCLRSLGAVVDRFNILVKAIGPDKAKNIIVTELAKMKIAEQAPAEAVEMKAELDKAEAAEKVQSDPLPEKEPAPKKAKRKPRKRKKK
jgi:hypothetical protein